ncbi:hypothetical protein QCA50_003340 [Cerrena zonata]|uniref:Uncharacterized protein n=1 Tax=Cerrena zonata TaxID=2478898 RepID=A0AAW0GTS9_9APHY
MPSLRRTLSSPTVRSSPYSYSSPSSSLLTRQGSHGPRRSSGSDTIQRKVLADIDWWRVEESQREVRGLPPLARPADANHQNADAEHEYESETGSLSSVSIMTDVPLWQPAPGSGGAMHESELSLFSSVLSTETESAVSNSPESLSPQFAALSLSSRVNAHRRLVSSSASSISSVESTPTSLLSPLAHFSDMGFGDIVPHVEDDDDAAFIPSLPRARRRTVPLGRCVSYSQVEDQLSTTKSRTFDDLFDDAFSDEFFAQTRTEVEDLFL